MSDNPRPESRITVFTYDRVGGITEVREMTEEQYREYEQRMAEAAATEPPPVRFEHDPAGRVFRLTAADGIVEVFRDNPTRYLCVEPDPESGAMKPVMKHGRPVFLHLCREEREVR